MEQMLPQFVRFQVIVTLSGMKQTEGDIGCKTSAS